jgi:transcriptional regulator with XRE-family HTH domain
MCMSGTKQPETLIARLLRALSGLSQAMFGKRTGRSPVLIDEWEQGGSLPGEPDLAALAELGAGISRDDAGELLELYETQRSAFRRRLDGAGALLDGLTAALNRHASGAVRRLLTLPAAESPPSPADRDEAEARFVELRRLGDRIFLIRVTWLEGRILAGLGRRDEARHLLADARRRFEDEEMPYDVALCLLEEAGLLHAAGRTREVKALTLELTGVFQSKGVHHEARKALRLFQQAVETDAATAGLVRDLLAYLFLARHDEGKRFEA